MSQKHKLVVLAGFLFMSFGAFSDLDSFREKTRQAGVTAEELQAYLELRMKKAILRTTVAYFDPVFFAYHEFIPKSPSQALQDYFALPEEATLIPVEEVLLLSLAVRDKVILTPFATMVFMKALTLHRDKVISEDSLQILQDYFALPEEAPVQLRRDLLMAYLESRMV